MSDNISDIEKEARSQGWVSQEEFRGGEDHWVDAETFVKRGRELNPILRANNERLKKELQEQNQKFERDLAEVRQAAEEVKKVQREAYQRKQEQLEAEIKSLKQERKEAIRDRDPDKQLEIEDRLEELEEQRREAAPEPERKPQQAETQLDPSVTAWTKENPWFGKDVEASNIANGIAAALKQQEPTLVGKAFFDKLDERLKRRLPELYENENQQRAPVDSGGTRPTGNKKTTYDTLPAEAQRACDKYVKNGVKLNKNASEKDLIAEYIELYEG